MMRDRTVDHDTIIISFRGTEPFNADDWSSDFDISWYELQGIGKIHGGFMKALGLQKSLGWPKQLPARHGPARPLAYYTLRERLTELLQQSERSRFVVTGHSLGGALAILFPAILAFHGDKLLLQRLEGVYTFGQPRVGDAKFGEFMVRSLWQYKIRYYRFVYGFDMVPRLPLDDKALMFKHFGPCIYFDWNYVAQVINYIIIIIMKLRSLLINLILRASGSGRGAIQELFLGGGSDTDENTSMLGDREKLHNCVEKGEGVRGKSVFENGEIIWGVIAWNSCSLSPRLC